MNLTLGFVVPLAMFVFRELCCWKWFGNISFKREWDESLSWQNRSKFITDNYTCFRCQAVFFIICFLCLLLQTATVLRNFCDASLFWCLLYQTTTANHLFECTRFMFRPSFISKYHEFIRSPLLFIYHTYPDMYKVTSQNHRLGQLLGGSIPLSVRHKHNSCLLFAPVGSSGHQRTQWI